MKDEDRPEYDQRIADRRAQIPWERWEDKKGKPPQEYHQTELFSPERVQRGIYQPWDEPPHGNGRLPLRFTDPPRGIIELSDDDVREALGGADLLRDGAISRGYREVYGAMGGRQIQRIGALGEIALARALGVPWEPQPGTHGKTADAGGWQVRTRSGPHQCLCLQPELKDVKWPFMLVQIIEHPNVLRIAGWIWGVDGHQTPWYRLKSDGRSYLYWVPSKFLHDQPLENTYVKRSEAPDSWTVTPRDAAADSKG